MWCKQFRLIDEHLYDPKSGLYYHGWDEKRAQDWADKTTGLSSNFWGRAVGWWAMAQVDVLDFLPRDHPGRAEIIALIKKTSRRHREMAGRGKRALVAGAGSRAARKGNYLEATASAMFVYSMAKAVNNGYLSRGLRSSHPQGLQRHHQPTHQDGWQRANFPDASCCSVAGLGYGRDGSYEYYLREPVIDNDLKGVGPFILAGIEVQKLLGLPMTATHERKTG